MAKRKRLILPDATPELQIPSVVSLETKAYLAPGLSSAPPIAQVAGDASATAALRELSDLMAGVRADGRLVARLPLDGVEDSHLLRDRLEADEEGLAALTASIRTHGQRMPVEVTDLGNGRYGLISGWRRLVTLRRLLAETGEARFGEVLALIRHPASTAEAYVAMVEENEVRQGVSHYERARVAARAADMGVFPDERTALSTLFATASRPRRSKIGSFIAVYRALDGALRFPAALPERLGLRLAKLAATDGLAPLTASLVASPPTTAAEEQVRIGQFLAGGQAKDASVSPPVAEALEVRQGVFLTVAGGLTRPVLTLSGPAVDPEFRERLMHWLQTGS